MGCHADKGKVDIYGEILFARLVEGKRGSERLQNLCDFQSTKILTQFHSLLKTVDKGHNFPPDFSFLCTFYEKRGLSLFAMQYIFEADDAAECILSSQKKENGIWGIESHISS